MGVYNISLYKKLLLTILRATYSVFGEIGFWGNRLENGFIIVLSCQMQLLFITTFKVCVVPFNETYFSFFLASVSTYSKECSYGKKGFIYDSPRT